MGDTILGTTIKETNLGVKLNADMKVSEQCGIAALKESVCRLGGI